MILKTKIKPLSSLCEGVISVSNIDGAAWITDGGAIYKVSATEIRSEQEVFKLLNIPKREKFFLEIDFPPQPQGISFEDQVVNEYLVDPNFNHSSKIIRKTGFGFKEILFQTPDGILAINQKYFSPLKKYKSLQLYERTTEDEYKYKYLAVKTEGRLIAIILPVLLRDKKLLEELSQLGEKCQLELEKLERVNQNDKII